MYSKIKKMDSLDNIYAKELIESSIIDENFYNKIKSSQQNTRIRISKIRELYF